MPVGDGFPNTQTVILHDIRVFGNEVQASEMLPRVVVEVFDYDNFGAPDFLGRVTAGVLVRSRVSIILLLLLLLLRSACFSLCVSNGSDGLCCLHHAVCTFSTTRMTMNESLTEC